MNTAEVIDSRRSRKTAELDSASHRPLRPLEDHIASLQQAQEEQERSLARDLHNLVGQSLTSIGLGVEAARLSSDPQELANCFDQLKEAVRAAAIDVRRLMQQLRPAVLDDLGVAAAIPRLVREACGAGLDCRFECRLEPGRRFAEPLETAVYRIVQTLLHDTVHFAKASRSWVRLWVENDRIRLSLADDGCGWDADPLLENHGKTLGLPGIRCRVQLLHGSVEVVPQLGGGKIVQITLPNTMEIA